LDPDASPADLGYYGGESAPDFEYYDDDDADGMYDGWETRWRGDTSLYDLDLVTVGLPASADSDNDGLTDREEFELGQLPTRDDSDGDGTFDAFDAAPLDYKYQ
jgi:hypothetical protein